jgi:hypothetical protein
MAQSAQRFNGSDQVSSGFGHHRGHKYIFGREKPHTAFKIKINGIPVPQGLGPDVYTEEDVRKKAQFLIEALMWGQTKGVLEQAQ